MRELSFVWLVVGHLKMGDDGEYDHHWIVGIGMKATDLLVLLSLIGVMAEIAHDFNICVISEGDEGRKKGTGRLRYKELIIYTQAVDTAK